jgi:hypothetical protein
MTYEDVYKGPFTRRYSKVFTKDYGMAFDFPMPMLASLFPNYYPLSEQSQDDILKLLNGKSGHIEDLRLHYDPTNTIIYANEIHPFIIVRGWGHLTGTGTHALKLSAEEAVKIQTDFAHFIISRLTK